MRFSATLVAIVGFALPGWALDSSQGAVTLSKIASGLDEPWGIAFLPEGGVLITERDGRLIHLTPEGGVVSVQGVPEVVAEGQGGLLDVMVPRDFAESSEVFVSFSIKQDRGSGTALAKLTLNADGTAVEDSRIIFQQAKGSSGGRHFGSRIVEAPDGRIFLTIGDRGAREEAQNLSNHNGTVVRINRSGTIPPDNPFVGLPGAEPEIWSYGHRNAQGAALDLEGYLWTVEHGAKGGDEVNRITAGANYGWPVISYGRHYSGAKIGEGTAQSGMEQPAHFWDPSMAPSGMMIYSGKLWPEWRGDIFIGSLKFDYISRLSGEELTEVEQLKSSETGRVRDIVEGPNGGIWFLSVQDGALYRMTPGTS